MDSVSNKTVASIESDNTVLLTGCFPQPFASSPALASLVLIASRALVHFAPLPLGKEDNKDDEEHNEDQENLNHQPAVGRDWLEVFEDLAVCHIHVQLGVLHVSINP